MPNPNAIVDRVSQVTAPVTALTASASLTPPAPTAVQFHGGVAGHLAANTSRSAVWAHVLESSRQEDLPVYVEVHPTTKEITTLLVPILVRVVSLTPIDPDQFEVELEISSSKHYLSRKSPYFAELHQALVDAQMQSVDVLVTETLDTHEIIDVRHVAPAPVEATALTASVPAPAPAPTALTVGARAPSTKVHTPPSNLTPVTPARAKELFEMVSAGTCSPTSPASTCIPFLYPRDGCWGRGSEMCRLMVHQGINSGKIWTYGSLHVPTRNDPQCEVKWGYHIAPFLKVHLPDGSTQNHVLDPSMFDGPVEQSVWVEAQNDSGAMIALTADSVFFRNKSGEELTDANFAKTRSVLATYRETLRLQSVGPDGPPPYAHCHIH